MAKGDDDATEQNAAILADPAVGDQTSEDRRCPGAACIGSIDRCRTSIRKPKTSIRSRCGHVKDEKCPHAVIAEALPHLGEEERGNTAGMSRPACIVSVI